MTVNSTNYKFNTPVNGSEEDTWGDKLNENWDKMDSLLHGASYTDGDGYTVEQIQPDLAQGSWSIAGTAVTATATELNILDGVTATTAELNILDGATVTTPTTVAGADGVVMNDAGTMKQVPMTNVATYVNNQTTTLDLQSLDVDSITINGSTISTNTTSTNLTLEPDSAGNVILNTDTVEMTHTGSSTATYPRYEFFNSDFSPSVNNSAGGIFFHAYDSNNVKRAYATIESEIDVVTAGSIDGKIVISVAEDGTVASKSVPKLTINSTTVKVEDNFVIGTSTSVDSIKDEDTMTSDSATALATQQSIKAYVDAQVGSIGGFGPAGQVTGSGSGAGSASNTVTIPANNGWIRFEKVKVNSNEVYSNMAYGTGTSSTVSTTLGDTGDSTTISQVVVYF